MGDSIWVPRSARKPPLELGDLAEAVPGPDPRYQSHGQGCQCGDLDCPWYAGEHAHLVFENASAAQRLKWAAESVEAMQAPPPLP